MTASRYKDLILAALSDAARKALQMIPEGYQFQSPIIRASIEKGILQGHAEGRAEGRAFEKALSVLEVFEARDIPVSPDDRSRILACTDLECLSRWHKRAITVASVDELFTQQAIGSPLPAGASRTALQQSAKTDGQRRRSASICVSRLPRLSAGG